MDNVTKVFSTHTLKVGYQLNDITAPIIQPPNGQGYLGYYGSYSDIPDQAVGQTSYAQLLLIPSAAKYPQYGGIDNLGGLEESYITSYSQSSYRHWYMGAFAQDDWRVTPKLTLNLGLRWEMTSPYFDIHGHLANFVQDGGGSSSTATYYIAKDGCNVPLSPAFKTLLAQDNVAIKCADSNVAGNYQHLNFAPRFGFAYSLTPRMVLRGGYGIAYGGLQNVGYGPLGQNYPFITSSDRYSFDTDHVTLKGPDGTTTASMENAFTIPGMLDPVNTPLNALQGTRFAGRAYDWKTPYQETFNLTFQHQLTEHDVFSVGYVGTLGRHLQTYSSNNDTAYIAPVGTNIHNPSVTGHVPFVDLGTGTTTTSNSTSSYNSMQAIFQHQFSYGVDLNANYTWSKCMTDTMAPGSLHAGGVGGYRALWVPGFGMRGDWSLCAWDATNVTHVTTTWHLPIGRGKAFLGDTNRLTDAVLGGWVTNLIYIHQGGQPITIGCQGSFSNHGCYAFKAQGTDIYAGGRTRAHWLNAAAFANPSHKTTVINQTDFSVLGGSSGQARGPAFQNIDMSLFKQFEVHEEKKFEFRAEAFNLANWAEYAKPSNLNFKDPVHFGQITGVRNNNRILQLALKFYY